jgi:hypothetical protein
MQIQGAFNDELFLHSFVLNFEHEKIPEYSI